MKFRPSLIFLGVVLLGLFPSSAQTIQQTQTFRLDAGWNLIVFQLVPPDPTPAVVFGTLGNSFERAWAYDNAHKVWSSYARPGIEQSQHNDILLMEDLDVGRAYWLYMNSAVPSWSITGSAPTNAPPVDLKNGWNLIGVPTGAGIMTEPVNMATVLAASGANYDVILRWEQGQYKRFSNTNNVPNAFSPCSMPIKVKGTHRLYLSQTLEAAFFCGNSNGPPKQRRMSRHHSQRS